MGSARLIYDELTDFFHKDVSSLPIVARRFTSIDIPNLHRAVRAHADRWISTIREIGYATDGMSAFHAPRLSDLISRDNTHRMISGRLAAPQYRQFEIGENESLTALESGLYLLEGGSDRRCIHIRTDLMIGLPELEVMAPTASEAKATVEAIRSEIARVNVYKGKVLSLEMGEEARAQRQCSVVVFRHLEAVAREDVILPESVLDLIERNTIGFFKHSEALRKSGRSVKRGLLLHGAPGTGKTHTARWLAGAIPGLTVILVSGEQLWLVKEACRLARLLSPSMVVMEDVDLIATERTSQEHPATQTVLHQLLNEMDGLNEDTATLFLLTTNRPEAVEPAIAARPGRIDQAIEYPLPDAECRRRLFKLYQSGLVFDVSDVEVFIAKTEGASPAFIRELLRKAALYAAEAGSEVDGTLRVVDEHLESAIRELIFAGGSVTRNLLGFPTS